MKLRLLLAMAIVAFPLAALASSICDQGAPNNFNPWPTSSAAQGPGTNTAVTPAAGASGACTGLVGSTNYWLTCDQIFRLRQGTATPTATSTDFGPIAANTILHLRLGSGKTAWAFFNTSGTNTANCSCAPDVN